jgi:hypothetical protein
MKSLCQSALRRLLSALFSWCLSSIKNLRSLSYKFRIRFLKQKLRRVVCRYSGLTSKIYRAWWTWKRLKIQLSNYSSRRQFTILRRPMRKTIISLSICIIFLWICRKTFVHSTSRSFLILLPYVTNIQRKLINKASYCF